MCASVMFKLKDGEFARVFGACRSDLQLCMQAPTPLTFRAWSLNVLCLRCRLEKTPATSGNLIFYLVLL